MSTAEYQRRWRASKGARTGRPGPKPTQPCGTSAAYRRHERAGEVPCAACDVAYKADRAAYMRAYYQRTKRTPQTPQ